MTPNDLGATTASLPPAITSRLHFSGNETTSTSPLEFIHDAFWVSYLALERQLRVYDRRVEQSQRREGVRGTHLFVARDRGQQYGEVEEIGHQTYTAPSTKKHHLAPQTQDQHHAVLAPKTTHYTSRFESYPNPSMTTLYPTPLLFLLRHSRIIRSPSSEYEYEVFKMTQPGLSSFGGNPDRAVRSLDVLPDEVVRVVPKATHGYTLVAVKATAGFRGGGEDSNVLSLQEKDGVVIMGGKDEGVYTWIMANYLLGPPKLPESAPLDIPIYAVLDLGGASTQIVFEPRFASDIELREVELKYSLQFGGRSHVLYHYSLYVDVAGYWKPKAVVVNPCLAKGMRRVVNTKDDR
ncbi:hypothetical protein K443DRAFT_13748 [Laccaria amethystina LaAM-08-1]|uniref:guanosine-diphosphatase n=1 Tax=Laccaria amethystina LaAM-08-1 TaxID=1095629 RepID=A0A0C9WUM1_9AGAR|nr:hypothetical protein K443DRAFT_13748 [Laccaria amethystina LaAM-08-1]